MTYHNQLWTSRLTAQKLELINQQPLFWKQCLPSAIYVLMTFENSGKKSLFYKDKPTKQETNQRQIKASVLVKEN